MTIYLITFFTLFIINIVSYTIILSKTKYPRLVTTNVRTDLFALYFNIMFAIWTGILLFR